MDPELLTAFVAFAVVASVTPGPNNLMVLASGAVFGWRRTAPHVMGIAFGFAAMLCAVALGLGAILEQAPEVLHAVRIGGAAWLLWLAFLLVRPAIVGAAAAGAGPAMPARPLRFVEAALFQWVNPKAWSMTLAASAAYSSLAPDPLTRTLAMALVFLLVGPVCNGLWVMAGQSLRRLTGEGAAARFFSVAMGGLVAATAVAVLVAGTG